MASHCEDSQRRSWIFSLVVIGAGVIGASTALALQADGHKVTLIDREAPCAGASFGNAGAVVNASCPPTAMPGIVSSALRMLGQPLAPLKIQPAYLHKILPWLIRFVLESRHSSVTANARSLHTLTNRSITGWRKLTDGTDLTDFLREGGWLKVYGSDRSFDATRYTRELMDANNVPYETLSAAEILDLEPNLAPIYERGIFQQKSWILNPTLHPFTSVAFFNATACGFQTRKKWCRKWSISWSAKVTRSGNLMHARSTVAVSR